MTGEDRPTPKWLVEARRAIAASDEPKTWMAAPLPIERAFLRHLQEQAGCDKIPFTKRERCAGNPDDCSCRAKLRAAITNLNTGP